MLVLGGGGILGEAWMTSLLAGLADVAEFDARECEGYVGTSAGSIVAAALVAGSDPRTQLGELPEQPPVANDEPARTPGWVERSLAAGIAAGGAAAAPAVALGLRSTAAAGAALRRAALQRAPRGRRSLARLRQEIDAGGAGWDGRLAIAAVEVESGRRVMFGTPDAPVASVGSAVEASCAIPGVFRPVAIAGRTFVDGGVWSPTNMDVAPAGRGSSVLCLNPTGAFRPSRQMPFGAVGLVSRSAAALEAVVLERRGASVRVVAPDQRTRTAMGPNLMDPQRRGDVMAAGLAQGRALG